VSAGFETGLSRHIWETKYRFAPAGGQAERDIGDSWRRIAHALAAAETTERERRAAEFREVLDGFAFLPGGRIQAGAGTERRVTLFNCFVMGAIEDSIDGIFTALREGALTMQYGGGVGYDFSTLRPAGAAARAVGTVASGPVSFMRIWDAMCGTLLSTGARRGAMMAVLRCDHPDVERFIDAKRDPGELRHFNLSVLVSDAFMQAVRDDRDWPLVFPLRAGEPEEGQTVTRAWPGHDGPVPCRVMRRVPARGLWERIMRATYDVAEPGILFGDRINRLNNLYYRETIGATNPCGEIPLPPYGACNLGSLNLVRFVREPFRQGARMDLDALARFAAVAVRMLDNVTDLSRFPLEAQRGQAQGSRRIGLGITGLADALIMLGIPYGEERARVLAADIMATVCHTAYRASIDLAREKSPFPFFDRDAYLAGEFVSGLPAAVRDGIARHGIRNSHLTAIAPTGTISLLADNVSSGIEPVFEFEYTRRVLEDGEHATSHEVSDYAWRHWRAIAGRDAPTPAAFVDARMLDPRAHIDMQAALQPYVDGAISKTVNVPRDYPFEAFSSLYDYAWQSGVKGCTTFRPNPVTGEVLSVAPGGGPRCCAAGREPD